MMTGRFAKMLGIALCCASAACAHANPPAGRTAAAAVAAESRSAGTQAPDELLLLGTAGGPLARADRSGIATLLTLGGKRYLVDAGDGVVHQLGKAGLESTDIPTVFLTHLHDDHFAGLPGLASFGYTIRGNRMDIYGPDGTDDLVDGIHQVMEASARIRRVEQRIDRGPEEFAIAHEYITGPVFDDGNVKVTAIANTHFDLPPGSPAASNYSYSLRFEGDGKVIVFTGDTGPSDAVTELARGADILVAEMASLADRASVPPFIQAHMDREHLSPLEVGKMAAAAGVKTLVLSHIGVAGDADVAVIRSVFDGRVVLGADMTAIPF